MARWVIAYVRDSLSGLSTGATQAVSAAFAADAFQAMTAFDYPASWRSPEQRAPPRS
jgi:propanediol dehydratase small subunit